MLCTQLEGRGCHLLDVGSWVAEGLASARCHVPDHGGPNRCVGGEMELEVRVGGAGPRFLLAEMEGRDQAG